MLSDGMTFAVELIEFADDPDVGFVIGSAGKPSCQRGV